MANHDQYDLDMLKTLKRIAATLESINENISKLNKAVDPVEALRKAINGATITSV